MNRTSRHRIFVRMFLRPLLVRRGPVLTAVAAVMVAAAVSTATLNLYTDVQAKLHREFRSYGANVVVTAKAGFLPDGALARVDAAIGNRGVAIPLAFAVARTASGAPVVVAGVDFDRARRLNTWWSVTSWPSTPGAALFGKRAYGSLAPGGGALDLKFERHSVRVIPAGILSTGGDEDSRIYLSLADFTRWTGLASSTIEIGVTGSTAEIQSIVANLGRALPQAEVQPIRQMVEGETRVLGKTRATLLASTAIIILTAALCMLATLTASVFDRRKDFAVMRALGASQRNIVALFAAEAGAIGCAGAVLGYALGLGIAAWIGQANFHASVSPRFVVLPEVLAGSVVLAILSALAPISLLQKVQPATILRGE